MKTIGEFLVFLTGLIFGTGSSILAKTLFEVKVYSASYGQLQIYSFLEDAFLFFRSMGNHLRNRCFKLS